MVAQVAETIGSSEDRDQSTPFTRHWYDNITTNVPEAWQPAYLRFGQPEASWHGIARFIRKQMKAASNT